VSASICSAATPEPGLLFYLSGDHGFTADYAAGNPEPHYLANVKIIADGARGQGVRVRQHATDGLLGARQYLRAARHAGLSVAFPVPGGSHGVPDFSRRLRGSLEMGHGLAAHRLHRRELDKSAPTV
jgi:hypothetical protein